MGDLDNSPTVQITGTIMVIAVIVLFLVVVFVLFLHLYAKWFWWRVEEPAAPPPGRRHAFDFTPGQEPAQRGLDPSLLRSLPAVIVQIEDLKDGLECAVCVSEIVQGQRARVLPKCNHGFHVDCIDMWFHSHSTCPLCRSSVSPHPHSSISAPTTSNNDQLLVSGCSSNFPTNVLFWGDQTRVSAGAGILEETTSSTTDQLRPSASSSSRNTREEDRMLVIDDAPVQMSDSFAEDESKSPAPTRLRSLKRLLSRDRRMALSSSSNASSADEV